MSRLIGIYPGTFDPVHTGHIAFALQALQSKKLDVVYFLPERRPRTKQQVEHFAHRVAMLKQATKPHPQFDVLELVDISFSVERTLPKLNTLFAGDKLFFLLGSDVFKNLPSWRKSDNLIKSCDLIIGLRSNHDRAAVSNLINKLIKQPESVTLLNSYAPNVSSRTIREALRRGRRAAGILRSVETYSNRHWLYISLAIDRP